MQGLNIVKSHIYIKQITPESDSMGRVMWRCLIQSLYGRQLEAMNMKPLDGLFTADDVPFPRDGDGDEMASFDNNDRAMADEELTPAERDRLEKLKAKVSPSTIKDFTVVAFSLLAQSHYKVMEIQMIVKSYDSQQSLRLNNFTAAHLKQAFDGDGKYWITAAEAEAVAKFLDPNEEGKFSAKHFIDLLNKDELTSLIQTYNMNNSVFYASLVEGLEHEQFGKISALQQ